MLFAGSENCQCISAASAPGQQQWLCSCSDIQRVCRILLGSSSSMRWRRSV